MASGNTNSIDEAEQVEYKYVICDNSGHGARWEERPNRTVHLSALVAATMIPPTGAVNVVENFTNIDDDELRFRGGGATLVERTRSASVKIQSRMSGDGSQIFGEREGVADADMERFAPTIRERLPSMSLLGPVDGPGSFRLDSHHGSFRRESNSLFGPVESGASGYEQEFPPAAVAGGAPEDTAGEGLTALVREESCSNLFMDEFEPAEEYTAKTSEFEDSYALVGNGPLGEGTFGLVWRCTPKKAAESHKEMAAKIVRKARLQPRDMRYLLGEDGEVQLHLTMKHPHIVQLFEYFDEAATVTLVLEYCRGGDLFDSIVAQSKKTGRGFTEKQSAIATRHVMSALSYMHAQSVVHRDIKCENILLQHLDINVEDNVFKLCDFGFAAHDKGDGLLDRLGSPDTVAPEVVVGTRYGTPVDLWSAGVLIYMMLSATPPFYATTDSEVLRKVRTGSYSLSGEPWDGISSGPKNLIASLMTVEPRM
eukprot:CAMPEP_0197691908 /NCGR_PEP_ID=MMETSP1338-20131121/110364_1 /TAXON_ID=43686 ORGANISM="Pelagodinium beii, Strain RCC1491" /NCGR_SAMPLE_ID=MMETSP1338 /ASSEMBLY_ACC=CAM_ASM_000754 /LENGTH=481 /DNA_ID=CAMNT_0043274511 /DNA_START=153 /DNA_END=1596 /DNA_ORIENTATION=-